MGGHLPVRLERPTARTWAAIAASVLGIAVVMMQFRLTGYALVDLVGALGGSPDEAAWVNTVYAVTELAAIPLARWLSDRWSPRRVFVPSALAFALVSLAATRVTTLEQLVALRALQGFFGGPFVPMSTPAFRRKLPYRHRLLAFALFGVAMSVPLGLAPALEALCVDELSWRLVFVPPAALCLVAAALAAWGMPVVPVPKPAPRVDLVGTLLLPLGLGLIVIGVDQANRLDWFDSPAVVGFTVAGALVLIDFLRHEGRRAAPFIPLDLLANKNFLIGLVTFATFSASMIAVAWALPGFLQRIEGFRPSDFVDLFAAMSAPQLLVPFLVVRASRRLDLRVVLGAGVAMQALACLRLATLTSEWQAPELLAVCALHGMGQALFFTPVLALLTVDLDLAHRAGSATLVNLTRVFCTAVGVSIASTYVTQREHLHHAMDVEYLRADLLGAQPTLDSLRELAVAHGLDGNAPAVAIAGHALRREAFVLAYGDLFLLIGAALLAVLLLVAWLSPIRLAELRPRRRAQEAAG